MNRSDLQALTKIRIRESKVLLDTGQFHGAYYLCGYAVECALKSCIAEQTQQFDFPDKKKAISSHTHNLGELFRLSGKYGEFEKSWKAQPDLERNWGIVSNWSEASRYNLSIAGSDAKIMYWACSARKNGVLTWIRKRW